MHSLALCLSLFLWASNVSLSFLYMDSLFWMQVIVCLKSHSDWRLHHESSLQCRKFLVTYLTLIRSFNHEKHANYIIFSYFTFQQLTPDDLSPKIKSLLADEIGNISKLATIILFEQSKGQVKLLLLFFSHFNWKFRHLCKNYKTFWLFPLFMLF